LVQAAARLSRSSPILFRNKIDYRRARHRIASEPRLIGTLRVSDDLFHRRVAADRHETLRLWAKKLRTPAIPLMAARVFSSNARKSSMSIRRSGFHFAGIFDTLGPGSDLPKGIDKSALAVAAPRRYRNREHLRYVTSRHASCAAASHPTLIIFDTSSRRRLAASLATSSLCRCAGLITEPFIAPATSELGGRPTALTQSRSRASCGSTRV
jgi:hypothetical protein